MWKTFYYNIHILIQKLAYVKCYKHADVKRLREIAKTQTCNIHVQRVCDLCLQFNMLIRYHHPFVPGVLTISFVFLKPCLFSPQVGAGRFFPSLHTARSSASFLFNFQSVVFLSNLFFFSP